MNTDTLGTQYILFQSKTIAQSHQNLNNNNNISNKVRNGMFKRIAVLPSFLGNSKMYCTNKEILDK